MSIITITLPVGADLITDRRPMKPRTDKYHPEGYTTACVYIQGAGVTHWGRCVEEIVHDLFGVTVVSNSRHEHGYGTFTHNGDGIFYGTVRGAWNADDVTCIELCQGENEHGCWDPCPHSKAYETYEAYA